MSSGDIKIKRGTKIDPAEAKKKDRAKMGVGRPTPPPKEVEGQELYLSLVICPWCGAVNHCILDTNVYLWFTCWNCGGPFSA